MTIHTKVIKEKKVVGRRLGRHVAHDPQSWRYPAPMIDKIVSVQHETRDLPLDQGSTGSCTGNALAGLLMSDVFYQHTMKVTENRPLDETNAVHFYSRATHLDGFKGIYPPDDSGSSGLAVMKVAKQEGYLDGYAHCFSLEHAIRTICLQPTISGFNWYSGMDSPDDNGVVKVAGNIRGGHEFLQIGVEINDKKDPLGPNNYVLNMQSWGVWGLKDSGIFKISIPDFGKLMKEQGDVKTGILLP